MAQDPTEKIIEIAIALFVEAYIFPPALTAMATATLTSVNPGVTSLFQILTPLIAVVATVYLYYRTVKEVA